MNLLKEKHCPCSSGKAYENCCKMLHDGVNRAQTALELMVSRYSAYAMKQANYIIHTTHPNNDEYSKDFAAWTTAIDDFMNHTTFESLNVLDYHYEEGSEAFVTFQAVLTFQGKDCSFTERSRFVKENDRWYYESGEIFEKI